jgi:ABC-type lipoprotein release transport system permease subunit
VDPGRGGLGGQVTAVAAVLPATADPANPSIVAVSYPADILEAALVTKGLYPSMRAARLSPTEALRTV